MDTPGHITNRGRYTFISTRPIATKLDRMETHRGEVFITTAQLHSTKPKLRFCAGSYSFHSVSEIRDGEDL